MIGQDLIPLSGWMTSAYVIVFLAVGAVLGLVVLMGRLSQQGEMHLLQAPIARTFVIAGSGVPLMIIAAIGALADPPLLTIPAVRFGIFAAALVMLVDSYSKLFHSGIGSSPPGP